jgi:transposase
MMPVMTKRDARSLDHATLEEMRRLAVGRVEAGETQQAVADSLQVHRCSVAKWMIAFRKQGEAALASRKATGPEPKLTRRQRAQLFRWIVGRTPRQLKFPFALWSLPVVAEVIEKRFGVVLHKSTIARMLRQMGLTPQQPTLRAFARDDEECRRWAQEDFPAIVRQARRRQATLLFEDEAGVHENGPVDRSWAERGKRPVVRVTGGRRRVNVISAISPRGRLWFRCFQGTLTGPRFIGFLKDLMREVRGRIEMVLDKHPAHTAAVTRRFLSKHRARIRIHFLPGYAPDLNPDEHVWQHLKGIFRRHPILPAEKIESSVQGVMEHIAADRSVVRNFFGHPAVAYVKDALHW